MNSKYVVGWSPFHRDAGALELACRIARSTGAYLHVVSVLPSGWGGLGRRDAEAAEREGDRALEEARRHLESSGVAGEVVATTARSVPQALLEAVERTAARALVLGSGTDAATGRIDVSSKAGRLLHSSPVPVTLAPRGYRASRTARLERVTCAFRDEESSRSALQRASLIADAAGIPLRVVTFGVEPRSMVPSEVSGDAQMVLEEWRVQAQSALDAALAGLANSEGSGAVHIGRTWDEALHETDWEDGDLLLVGSSSTSPIAQVFLGSSATKIVRNSPVPVAVVPR